MKKKALALAVAGAFFAPASYAAQDTSGMQYTSAAEGFYASIRAQFSTESSTDGGAGIGNSSSRFGVRGTNDLGNGLKGFYQYEAGVGIDGGADGLPAGKNGLSTRVGQVGLEGAFGRVWVGSGWVETHNMTYGSTDIANAGSGNLTYSALRPGRGSNMIQYRTPDIGGFQGALGLNLKAGADNDDGDVSTWSETVGTNANEQKGQPCVPAAITSPHLYTKCVTADPSDDNNVEMWSAAGKYSVQGFTGAFAYSVRPDTEYAANMKEDATAWTARFGYAQDNWYVNGWYGKDNDSDLGEAEDTKFVSVAGGVAVGKVNMYGVWEQSDDGTVDNQYSVIGIQYNLGSRSRVWMDYNGRDFGAANSTEEDSINIGLRHDF